MVGVCVAPGRTGRSRPIDSRYYNLFIRFSGIAMGLGARSIATFWASNWSGSGHSMKETLFFRVLWGFGWVLGSILLSFLPSFLFLLLLLLLLSF